MEKTKENLGIWRRISRIVRFFGFFLSLALVFLVVLAVFLYGHHRENIPEVLTKEAWRPTLKSKVYAENGELIAEFGLHERIMVKKEDIPPLVIEAFLSSEDKNFYRHHGIDFMGVANAVVQSMSGQRKSLRGASTITQQLAKSLLVKQEGYIQATARTMARKIKEAILARRLEMHLSKEDILWIYLNEVYLGHGSYGVGAAARTYFHKDLKALSLNEIAIIAGLPQAPSRFSPKVNLNAAMARQSYVLKRMLEDGYINEKTYEKALDDNKNLKIYERENNFRKSAPYFSETVRRMLIEEFGEDRVYEDGLHIYTTLDIEQERIMQRVLKKSLIDIDKRQGFSGPIFRPTDGNSQKKAKKIIPIINKEIEASGYALASVVKIDSVLDAVFIDTGLTRGVIPLAGMLWARPRNPEEHFEHHRLHDVAGVVKVHDVVLVKPETESELEKLNQESSNKEKLHVLLRNIGDRTTLKKLPLFSLEQEPNVEGAMIAIEPATGYITAMNGGYSFDRSEFNRVYQACRQPGSAFKPVVYAAAVALKKYTPATKVIDAPLTFHDGNNKNTWRPKNLGHAFRGEVTVREALMNSMNIPAINVMADVGVSNVLAWAQKLGITTKLKAELGTGIGSSCVTPWELAQVFSIFANLGEMIEPILIKEITDRDHIRIRLNAKKTDPWQRRTDRIFFCISEFLSENKRVMEKEDAYTIHYLLTEAAKYGTAQRTNVLNRHIAGKTGTTNDSFDAWFVGYTKNLLSLVWIGNDTMAMPLGVYEQGGRTALPLFNDFMGQSLARLPDQEWLMPDTMCEARIDGKTGLRITTDHPLSFLAPFRCGSEPALLDSTPTQSLEQAMDLMSGN